MTRVKNDRRTALGLGLLVAFFSTLLRAAEPMTAPPGPQHLEITGQQHLRITYDLTFTWPRGGGYRAVFYLPVPPETGAQRIEDFTTTLKGDALSEGDAPPHSFFRGTLTHAATEDRSVYWQVQITGFFSMHRLMPGPRPVTDPPIIPPAAGDFLASTDSIDWKSEAFGAWLDQNGLRRHDGEAPVDFARRVYQVFKDHGKYSYPPEGGWKADTACRRLRTDCGGFSIIFTAACRANRIPARLLVGQWFKTREVGDGTVELTGRQSHVIAEFFDPQIGWVPEDISSTLLKIPGQDDYFGREPGYFFTWHTDTDFHFNVPRKENEKVQWIQNPSLWFSEDADAASDHLSHRWTLESLKAPSP